MNEECGLNFRQMSRRCPFLLKAFVLFCRQQAMFAMGRSLSRSVTVRFGLAMIRQYEQLQNTNERRICTRIYTFF